jgi:NADH-quinone oxidoreductase subunit H
VSRILKLLVVAIGVPSLVAAWAWWGYILTDWTAGYTHGGWAAELAPAIVRIAFIQLFFVMIVATLLTMAERKWSAAMQDRIGPNRAGRVFGMSFGGIPHIAADAIKMIFKEDIVPARSMRVLYHLAPVLNFAPIFCLFAIVPMGPPVLFDHLVGKRIVHITTSLQIANPDVGLLYVFGIASLAVYGVSLAGWASGNKLALLGGVRASAQMIAYEVALGLGLVGMMMTSGTLRLDAMIQSQSQGLFGSSWLPAWGIFVQPLGFLLFFAAAFAETKRAPFDLPEGESEIIGYFIEYSGMKFGMFMIAEFIEVVTLAGIVTAIFFGGWHLTPGLDASLRSGVAWLVHQRFTESGQIVGSIALTMAVFQTLIFATKVLVLCWLQLAIRWTFPRFRYDQVQTLGWRILLPLGIFNVFLTGACLLIDPSLSLLGAVGLAEIGLAIGMAIFTGGAAKVGALAAAPAAAGGGH